MTFSLANAITFWGPVLVFAGIVAWRPVIFGWALVIGVLGGFVFLGLFVVFSSIRPAAAQEASIRSPPIIYQGRMLCPFLCNKHWTCDYVRCRDEAAAHAICQKIECLRIDRP